MLKFIINNVNKRLLYSTIDDKIVGALATNTLITKNGKIDKLIKEKYMNKLQLKARENGFTNIEDYKTYITKNVKKTNLNETPGKNLFHNDKASKIEPEMLDFKSTDTKSSTPFKTLDSYINLNKFKQLNNLQIEQLWKIRFKDSISAVVPENIFNNMISRIQKYPKFLIPLPHKQEENKSLDPNTNTQGYDLHYLQWIKANNNMWYCLLTSLQEFKSNNEFARPHTILEFHLDLLDDKKIVLMNGSLQDKNTSAIKNDTKSMKPVSNAPTIEQIPLLIWHLQKIFNFSLNSVENEKIVKLLKYFNSGDSRFDINQLIKFCEESK